MACLLLVASATCSPDPPPQRDGGVDGGQRDALVAGDAGEVVLGVDFTVSGCRAFDTTLPRCSGRAPLTIELVPITTGGVARFLWDFGDETPRSVERTPSHTYAKPGAYDVSLIGGGQGGGTAYKKRSGYILVTSAESGEPCTEDNQCRSPGTCVCGRTERCAAPFARGFCAANCGDTVCGDGDVCADLSGAGRSSMSPEPWQRALCVRSCRDVGDCPEGTRCIDVPGRLPPGTWVKGCLGGVANEIGASCRGANGQIQGSLCVTGLCLDVGANGMCTADCTRTPCPEGATCVELSDRRRVCLKTCAGSVKCDHDPLLACERPNVSPLGFVAPPQAVDLVHCAPKRCFSNADCGVIGMCRGDLNGGNCAKSP